jgi:DNA invertase Pin-like site-specific DNA recombinase
VKSGATIPSSTAIGQPSLRRAVGVTRVSRVGDRDGEAFVSPVEQQERIEQACTRDGMELVAEPIKELDVSGGTPLDKRPGLRRAVEMIEDGDADVIVVAYFDRLVRSLAVQAEIVDRVERAGGAIVAVDVGEVRADTASRWLSSTMLGMVAEYHRRVTAERTRDAKRRAVERGIPPFPRTQPGFMRRPDPTVVDARGRPKLGPLEPDPATAPVVVEAFVMRAGGATVKDVREHLRRHGIERSFNGVQSMLSSRIYIGELRFGEHLKKQHPQLAIVPEDIWNAVQHARSPRGRRPKSERLLSRLGVLRCGTCGARMVVGTANRSNYWLYRCPPVGDCQRRVTISAEIAESVVVEATKQLLDGISGTASLGSGIEPARAEVERLEGELDAAVRAFSGLDDVEAARERLTELRDERDRARENLAELKASVLPVLTVTGQDWEDLDLDERRALIKAVIDRAVVSPGRGPDRITIEPRAQEWPGS